MSSGKVTVRGQRRKKNHTKARLILFGALVLLLILAAIFAETLCPYDPNQQDLSAALQPPGAGHLFGTDRYGRDMLSRVIVGARVSIFSALILVAVIAAAGTLIGMICGYIQGAADSIIMRIADICLAFPGLDCPGGDQLAQICEDCQGTDPGGEKFGVYCGSPSCGEHAAEDFVSAYSSQYHRAGAGDSHAGYRDHDDGDCGPVFSGAGRKTAHGRVGKYDERRKKYAADLSLDGADAGYCHFYFCCIV